MPGKSWTDDFGDPGGELLDGRVDQSLGGALDDKGRKAGLLGTMSKKRGGKVEGDSVSGIQEGRNRGGDKVDERKEEGDSRRSLESATGLVLDGLHDGTQADLLSVPVRLDTDGDLERLGEADGLGRLGGRSGDGLWLRSTPHRRFRGRSRSGRRGEGGEGIFGGEVEVLRLVLLLLASSVRGGRSGRGIVVEGRERVRVAFSESLGYRTSSRGEVRDRGM
jgi:hypothetical protein